MPINYTQLWSEVRENLSRLDACKRHRFGWEPMLRLGQKYECIECHGRMDGPALYNYLQGFEAAGGDADIVFPGWRKRPDSKDDDGKPDTQPA